MPWPPDCSAHLGLHALFFRVLKRFFWPFPGYFGVCLSVMIVVVTVRGLEARDGADVSPPRTDSNALSAGPGQLPLPPSSRKLWNFLALLTGPFAMCLSPPSRPHLWSPVSHLPLQELPTTNLFLADLIFLPTLTLPLWIFICVFPHFISSLFFSIPISACLFSTFVPIICSLPTLSPWSS